MLPDAVGIRWLILRTIGIVRATIEISRYTLPITVSGSPGSMGVLCPFDTKPPSNAVNSITIAQK
ncbi:hypothetical protein IWY39_004871 [Sphingobium sp. JAI105]|nr:hypothetical protein [Sphingobium sp. JAI105]